MCLAIPCRIVELDGDTATLEVDGVRRSCNVTFVRDPAIGDYVLVHAGFAIQKWSQEDMDEYRKIMDEMEQAGLG